MQSEDHERPWISENYSSGIAFILGRTQNYPAMVKSTFASIPSRSVDRGDVVLLRSHFHFWRTVTFTNNNRDMRNTVDVCMFEARLEHVALCSGRQLYAFVSQTVKPPWKISMYSSRSAGTSNNGINSANCGKQTLTQ